MVTKLGCTWGEQYPLLGAADDCIPGAGCIGVHMEGGAGPVGANDQPPEQQTARQRHEAGRER